MSFKVFLFNTFLISKIVLIINKSIFQVGWSVWDNFIPCLGLGLPFFLHCGSVYYNIKGRNFWDLLGKYKVKMVLMVTSRVDKLEKLQIVPSKLKSNFLQYYYFLRKPLYISVHKLIGKRKMLIFEPQSYLWVVKRNWYTTGVAYIYYSNSTTNRCGVTNCQKCHNRYHNKNVIRFIRLL